MGRSWVAKHSGRGFKGFPLPPPKFNWNELNIPYNLNSNNLTKPHIHSPNLTKPHLISPNLTKPHQPSSKPLFNYLTLDYEWTKEWSTKVDKKKRNERQPNVGIKVSTYTNYLQGAEILLIFPFHFSTKTSSISIHDPKTAHLNKIKITTWTRLVHIQTIYMQTTYIYKWTIYCWNSSYFSISLFNHHKFNIHTWS
jgi:hypothetical protein